MSAPTGALAVLGRRRGRVIDGGPTTHRTEHSSWLTGVLASAQACVLTVLLITLPALTVFVLSSGDPSNTDVSWFVSVRVGLGLWLLAHGVPVAVGGTTISMVPLGLSLLCGFVLHASARRTMRPDAAAYGAGIAAYAAATVLLVLVAGLAGGPQLVMAAVGGALVAALGLGAGYVTHPDGPRLARALEPVTSRLPLWMRLGMRAGFIASGLAVFVATLLLVVWIVAGRGPTLDIVHSLDVGGFDAVVLAAAQSMFAANLVLWALAWMSGAGFSFGAETLFSPTSAVVGPMPVVPLVGTIPTGQPAAAWVVVPAVLVLIGVTVGIFVHRRMPDRRWLTLLGALLATAVTAGLVVGVLVSLASGGVGPGRMQDVGADALVVGLVVAGEILAGAAVTAVLLHPASVAWFRGLDGSVRAALRRGRATKRPSGSEPAASAPSVRSGGTAASARTARTAGTSVSARTARTTLTTPTTRTVASSATSASAGTSATTSSVPSGE
ncbi:cell division protein PerM [Sanguibacter sp. A247]|uniref:cell division protein PerM n=1 Tax=unclassified Sanguibacter TaxID=2645534 RepID=UPI003FD7B933